MVINLVIIEWNVVTLVGIQNTRIRVGTLKINEKALQIYIAIN